MSDQHLSPEEILGNVETILEQYRERELSGNGGEEEQGKEDERPTPFLFACLSGSILYNLHLKSSDRDYLAVYVASLERLLAVSGTPRGAYSNAEGEEDYALYEVAHFVRYLKKGNPKLVQPLWCRRDHVFGSMQWDRLLGIRHSCLSLTAAQQFTSMAVTQFRDATADFKKLSEIEQGDEKPQLGVPKPQECWANNNRNPHKKMYHATRLIKEVLRILRGEDPLVYLVGEEREKILAIRKGERDLKELFEEFESDLEKVNGLMAILKERNKAKNKEENEQEFTLQQDMSLEPGSPIFQWLEGVRADQIQEWCKRNKNKESFLRISALKASLTKDNISIREDLGRMRENLKKREDYLQQGVDKETEIACKNDQTNKQDKLSTARLTIETQLLQLENKLEEKKESEVMRDGADTMNHQQENNSPPFINNGHLWRHTFQAMKENKELPEGSTLLALIPSGFLSISHNFPSSFPPSCSSFVPDYVGIFAFPAEAHLLLQAPDSFEVPFSPPFGPGSEGGKEKPAYYRGVRVYEIRRAMSLMLAGNHRLSEALFYSLKEGVGELTPHQAINEESFSLPPSPYQPIIAVSVWKDIAQVLKPRLFNAAVARHYEGLVTRNLKLMSKEMLLVLEGNQEEERKKEEDKQQEPEEKAQERLEEGGKGKEKGKGKGKGKGNEEKMSKEARRMKAKKSNVIMTKEAVSKALGGFFYHSLRLLISLSGFADEKNPSPKVDFDKNEIEDLNFLRDAKQGTTLLSKGDVRMWILKVEEKKRVVMEEVEKSGLLLNKFAADKMEEKKMTIDLDQWMFEIAMCLSKNLRLFESQ